MKYNDVSLELRNKIRQDMIIHKSKSLAEGGNHMGVIEFGLSIKEEDLYQEAQTWIRLKNAYFRTSFNACRMSRIGRFYNLRPAQFKHRKVYFDVEEYDDPSWRDWFDIEGNNDGDLIGVVGKVINERTSKYAYNE